jgi:hypothetical protein
MTPPSWAKKVQDIVYHIFRKKALKMFFRVFSPNDLWYNGIKLGQNSNFLPKGALPWSGNQS